MEFIIQAWIFLSLTGAFTFLLVKRMSLRGCATIGYVALLVGIVNVFSMVSVLVLSKSFKNIVSVLTSGEQYKAKVIRYDTYIDNDGDKMYTPIVEFQTNDGKRLQRTLNFSTSKNPSHKRYKIYYNQKNDEVIVLGFPFIMRVVGSILFAMVFLFILWGIISYGVEKDMSGYWNILQLFGTYIVLPALMIGFDAVLIYGLFFGNKVPIYASLLLLLFIIILTGAIFGYFKIMFEDN